LSLSCRRRVVEVELTGVKKRFARARLLRVVQRRRNASSRCADISRIAAAASISTLITRPNCVSSTSRWVICSNASAAFDPGLIAPVVPCPQPYGYRNRIMIRSQWDKFKQGLNIGFIRADNRLVVDIEECKIAEPALNEEIRRVARASAAKGGIKVVCASRRRAGRCRAIPFSRTISFCCPGW